MVRDAAGGWVAVPERADASAQVGGGLEQTADDAAVEHTVGHDAEIGTGAVVGPYAHLPAGSSVAPGSTTGSFYTAPAG